MLNAPIPENENERLARLFSLRILDTPAEERYDRITRLAKRVFDMPIALISIVDETRQWFKSAQGLSICQTPRNLSFCGHAIASHEVMVIPDAREDSRFFDNPLVTGEPHIRFYAGCPISSVDGLQLGTLCVVDQKPRDFTNEDMLALRDLARIVENEITAFQVSQSQLELHGTLMQSRFEAKIDASTELWNKHTILDLLTTECERCERESQSLAVVMADLDYFKKVNDTYGHTVGDEVLKEVAIRLRRIARTYDQVGRFGGEEFTMILPGGDEKSTPRICERFRAHVAELPVASSAGEIAVTLSLGAAVYDPTTTSTPRELLQKADLALYEAKSNGRNTVSIASPL